MLSGAPKNDAAVVLAVFSFNFRKFENTIYITLDEVASTSGCTDICYLRHVISFFGKTLMASRHGTHLFLFKIQQENQF